MIIRDLAVTNHHVMRQHAAHSFMKAASDSLIGHFEIGPCFSVTGVQFSHRLLSKIKRRRCRVSLEISPGSITLDPGFTAIHNVANGASNSNDAVNMKQLEAVEALRSDEQIIWLRVQAKLPLLMNMGPLDQKRVQHFMANARQHYGTCVKDLPADWPNGAPARPLGQG